MPEMTNHHRQALLLLFVDGLGLAPAGPNNPLVSDMQLLTKALGRPLTLDPKPTSPDWSLEAVDACLETPGLPQSATGQTAIFTGENASTVMGRHVPALPGPRLRAILEEHSVFSKLVAMGRRVTFANAFTTGYLKKLDAGEAKVSATTWSVLASKSRLRVETDLAAGEAVTWDIVGDLFAQRSGLKIPPLEPQEAGQRLAEIALGNDVTLFETFLTDLAGHRRFGITSTEALRRVDGLIHGVLQAGGKELTVALVSDHGNIEAADHKRHTRNPVPWLLHGPLTPSLQGPGSLTEIAPLLIKALKD